MANEKNLENGKATQFRSGEEAARNGQIGGIASGVSRRRKKSLKEAADLYLSLPVRDVRKLKAMLRDGIPEEDADNQMAVVIGLTKAAMLGDSKAAKVLIEMLGEDSGGNTEKKNNLLEAIKDTGEIDTDDLQEVE